MTPARLLAAVALLAAGLALVAFSSAYSARLDELLDSCEHNPDPAACVPTIPEEDR